MGVFGKGKLSSAGQSPKQDKFNQLFEAMPSVNVEAVPVELILALKPEMVQGQSLGMAPHIVALLGELREKYGLQKVEPLWPIGISAVELRPSGLRLSGVFGNLNPSVQQAARSFMTNAKMLMGEGGLVGDVTMAPEEKNEARTRLRLTFAPGTNGAVIEKRIESEKGVDYVEVVVGAAGPVLRAIGKGELEANQPPPANAKEAERQKYKARLEAMWARRAIGRPDGWDSLELNNIAILDSGVDSTHPGLFDAVDYANQESMKDPSGHGTFVAGVIAGRKSVATRKLQLNPALVSDTIDGLLPKSKVWVRNVMDPVGIKTNDGKLEYRVDPGRYSSALNRIAAAKTSSTGDARLKQIQVLNLSIGSSTASKTEQRDIKLLQEAGVLIVAAVGNQGGDILYPAAFSDVIAVGAMAYASKELWGGTNEISPVRELGIDICAPGDRILSSIPLASSAMRIPFSGWLSGTSMATPHVTAVAAVLLSRGVSREALMELMGKGAPVWRSDYPTLKCPPEPEAKERKKAKQESPNRR